MSSKISARFRNQLPNIWITVNKAVALEKPINLGQGFPDYGVKDHVMKNLEEVCKGPYNLHQYTLGHGHPRLVQVLSKLYMPSLKREINAQEEILVTIGAYGSLFCSINALTDPGDEAIIIEPFFDCYQPMVEAVGGVPKFISYKIPEVKKNSSSLIRSSDLYLDEEELRGLVNKKTKYIIINTPNNPNGRVMDHKELNLIAKICIEHDLICISDEVYEWMVYPPNKHLKIASLPGMWERTITIGSVGKTLNVTGWKLGWSIAPTELMKGIRAVSQCSFYTSPTPLQEAAARSLEIELANMGTPQSYFTEIVAELEQKRDLITAHLLDIGMRPIVPDGGYFILADFSDIISEEFIKEARSIGLPLDFHFNNWMMKNIKVSGIPNSAFFSKDHVSMAENYIRFCFFKKDETLKAAIDAFKIWKEKNGGKKI